MRRLVSRVSGLSALAALALAAVTVGTMFADDEGNTRKNNSGEGSAGGNCSGRNNCADGMSGSSDESHTSGEVLAINTLKEPNEIVLGNIDGQVYVKMYGKNAQFLIKESGIKVRDYIEVSGWKENENVFWADTISQPSDDDD